MSDLWQVSVQVTTYYEVDLDAMKEMYGAEWDECDGDEQRFLRESMEIMTRNGLDTLQDGDEIVSVDRDVEWDWERK